MVGYITEINTFWREKQRGMIFDLILLPLIIVKCFLLFHSRIPSQKEVTWSAQFFFFLYSLIYYFFWPEIDFGPQITKFWLLFCTNWLILKNRLKVTSVGGQKKTNNNNNNPNYYRFARSDVNLFSHFSELINDKISNPGFKSWRSALTFFSS